MFNQIDQICQHDSYEEKVQLSESYFKHSQQRKSKK